MKFIEFWVLSTLKLWFNLDWVIIGLFTLFFKCDGEESHLLFKILFKIDSSGFWIDNVSRWLFMLDSWELNAYE